MNAVTPIRRPISELSVEEAAGRLNALLRRPRQRMCNLPPATQAALLGKERRFWRFLAERHGEFVIDADQARRVILDLCGCREFRAELVPGSEAAARWAGLFTDYENWRDGRLDDFSADLGEESQPPADERVAEGV